MELRLAGMIMEPWPAATPTRALSVVARIIVVCLGRARLNQCWRSWVLLVLKIHP